MMLDVYYCACDEEFAVKEGYVPKYCPFCGNEDLAWSHEVQEA
ncbi:hypothetical protein [Mesobacillus zeae]|nr:hypothetical protein [Mesobacillus zeae]